MNEYYSHPSPTFTAQPGYSLPQNFYLDPDIYRRDMNLLLRRWNFVGHISELSGAGSWITAEIGPESVIVTRDEYGALRAFANVCRHRGSRICLEKSGRSNLLVCPYHAWTYQLDGRLRGAREMPKSQVAENGLDLHPLPLIQIGGLIFVSFGPNPPDISLAQPALLQMTRRYQWEHAKIAHRAQFTFDSNWKLALENYHECYHCLPAHPEFSLLHALARPGQRQLILEPGNQQGYHDVEDWEPQNNGREVVRVMRSALSDDCKTGSTNGKLLAPLMGPDDGHCIFAELGFLTAFLAYADYGVIYRFLPQGVHRTSMEVIWLVQGDAQAGRDYDMDALTWLWTVTSVADKTIIENNQRGVSSRFYQPGPFSPMEPGAQAYVERYLAELSAL
jgi:Rieske 2Fe-2S family protein